MSLHISLGCDCSVSYQLRKLGLQTHGTMPFDWMKLTSIDKLLSILDNDFNGFADFSKYDIKEQQPVFDYFDNANANVNDNANDNANANDSKLLVKSLVKLLVKSLVKLTHKEYGFILPHEYNANMINIVDFEDKYSRRIEKFRLVCRDDKIQKIFVRIGNKKEECKIDKLEEKLSRYGCNNFIVKFINMDTYNANIPEIKYIPDNTVFDWHRDYIPWLELLK